MANGKVREYIGARYIPIFADPVEWDIDNTYDPLTMVQHEGETFMTRQYVPAGVQLPNTAGDEESNDYWVHMSNWNAQVEFYRQEVLQFDNRIDALEDALPISDFNAVNTVDGRFDTIEANSWVTTDRLADENVTTAKIADDNVTTAKIADANVTTDKIADANVTTAKIADANVTTAKIADENVTTAKIADSNVTTAKIADANVTTAKLADSSVTTNKIADNSITKSKLKNDDIFLIFGDSWCNFVDHPDWATPVNKVLKCGSVLNYGVGGAGFTIAANSISTQVTTALNDLTAEQKNNVKYIVVMAGVNDHTPYRASTFATDWDSTMTTIKNSFPNALVQWFPTSCTPQHQNSTAPKWLFCIATFWWVVGRYLSGSNSGDESNRYCVPSCGPAFWFSSTSAPSAFFNDGLHLNNYGLHAVVNAVLDGFGLGNMEYFAHYAVARGGTNYISVSTTPTNIYIQGSYSNTGDSDLGETIGTRVLAAMAAIQCNKMFYYNVNPNSHILLAVAGGSLTYINIEPTTSFTKSQLSPAGSWAGGSTAYIGC